MNELNSLDKNHEHRAMGDKIELTITNSSSKTKMAALFFPDRHLHEPNFGSDEGIEIASQRPNVRYQQILNWLSRNKFETVLLELQCINPSQLSEIIQVGLKYPSGLGYQIPIITQSFLKKDSEPQTKLRIPYQLILDPYTGIAIPILPETTLIFRVFHKDYESLPTDES